MHNHLSRRAIVARLCIVGGILAAAACAADLTAPPTTPRARPRVYRVRIVPRPRVLFIGDTVRLVATALDVRGVPVRDASIVWGSGDARVGRLSSVSPSAATLSALAPGSALISATAGSVSGTLAVRVRDPAEPPAIALQPRQANLLVGGTVQMSAAVRNARGNPIPDAQIEWQSADSSVAAVSVSGLVTGRALGVASITATALQSTASLPVSVGESPIGTWSATVGELFESRSAEIPIGDVCRFDAPLTVAFAPTASGVRATTTGATARCHLIGSPRTTTDLFFAPQSIESASVDGVTITLSLEGGRELFHAVLKLGGTTSGGEASLAIASLFNYAEKLTGQWRTVKQ